MHRAAALRPAPALGLALALGLGCFVPAQPARADEPGPALAAAGIRLEGSVRAGAAFSPDTPARFSSYFSEHSPKLSLLLGLDAGLRIGEGWFVGVFLDYGLFGSVHPLACLGVCSTATAQAGVEVQWHPLGRSAAGLDPWVGLGTGPRWSSFDDSRGTASPDGPSSSTVSAVMGALQAGVDLPAWPWGRLGAWAWASVADAGSGGLHDPHVWIAAGARLTLGAAREQLPER